MHLFLLAACAWLPHPSTHAATEPADPSTAAKQDNDLAWAQAMNDAGHAPPATFRAGHVTPRTLPEAATARSEGRFEVRLPSGAPITTPAVYDGRVYTSGGFKGKEFYAFDARTGAFAWGRDLDDDGPSAPACEDGVCVFNTESCTVFALDARTGDQKWSWWMGDPMLSAPAIADGIVYTAYPVSHAIPGNTINGYQQQQQPATGASRPEGASHVLAALDLHTGEIRWQKWIDGDVISAPVVTGGDVHITTFTGTIYTFDAARGTIEEVRRGRATSAPTVVGGQRYWSERADQGATAGEQLAGAALGAAGTSYSANKRDAPYLDAQVQQQTGYVLQGLSLDAGNGFSGGAPASANAAPALMNVGQGSVSRLQAYQGSKVIHAFDNNYATMGDEVVSTDPATGEVRWSLTLDGDLQQAGGFLAAPPAVAGEHLVVATLSGEVLLLDPDTGEKARTISIGAPIRSQPLVWEGWVYVGTEDGRLIGVDTGDRSLSGWPMWGGDAARAGG